MASIVKNKQKRQAKATQAQIDYMVDYFVQHPHVATGKFQSLHGKSDLTASWERLVEDLNRMGKDGKVKDVKSWKSTWRDNKTTVSQKIAKIRENRSRTGNVGGPQAKLTEREEKIMGIMGFDYVEGVECPDAFPEEQLNAMELLAEGEESILDEDGGILTLRDCLKPSYPDYTDIEVLENFADEEQTLEEGSSMPVDDSDAALATAPPPAAALSEPGPSGLNQRKRASTVIKPNRRRFSTQLDNSRSDFATLAERQVSCMEMFAKAIEKMAENDRQRIQNDEQRNENDKERNKILRTLVESQKERDQVMLNLTELLQECVEHLKKET